MNSSFMRRDAPLCDITIVNNIIDCIFCQDRVEYYIMALTKAEVLHIAKLARLELKEPEVEKFRTQLSEILEYVGQLEKVDTEGIEPISQITGLQNVTRADLVRGCEKEVREAMLEQFPKRKGNLLETLGVFE